MIGKKKRLTKIGQLCRGPRTLCHDILTGMGGTIKNKKKMYVQGSLQICKQDKNKKNNELRKAILK